MKKNNIYSFSKIGNFRSIDDLPDPSEISLGDTFSIRHPIFRTGKFSHIWYGELDFDKEYLQTIKNNFDKGVVPNEIGVNLSHSTSQTSGVGNVGWIKNLFVRDGQIDTPVGTMEVSFLDAEVEYNSKGIELILDKRYVHSSAEIDNNYTTNEKYDVDLDELDGKEVEKVGDDDDEIIVNHGETLIGLGICNKPFIPSLGKIVEFSSGDKSEVEQDKVLCMDHDDKNTGIRYFTFRENSGVEDSDIDGNESTQNQSDGGKKGDGPVENADSAEERSEQHFEENDNSNDTLNSKSDLSRNDDESIESEEPQEKSGDNTNNFEDGENDNPDVNSSKQFDEKDSGDSKMKFADLLKQIRNFDDVQEQVEKLREVNFEQFDEGQKVALEQMLDDKTEQARKESQISKLTQEKNKLESQNEEYTEKLSEKELELQQAKEQGWQHRVDKFAEKLRNEGQHESVVKEVKTKLSDMTQDTRSGVTMLSDDGEKELDMIEFMDEIFASIPDNARLDESEKLEANKDNEVELEEEREVTPEPQDEEKDEETVEFEKRVNKYEEKYGNEPPSWVESTDDIDEEGNLIVDDE